MEFNFPTTPELLESVFVGRGLEQYRTESGGLRLGASIAGHLLGYLRSHAEYLTPEDRELKSQLEAFVGAWGDVQRKFWRALAFAQARASRARPARVEDRRREPHARESRPSRRTRSSANTRGSPASSSPGEDDEPPDLDAIAGFRVASNRMFVHGARRLGSRKAA
jgi:hypothetical protein